MAERACISPSPWHSPQACPTAACVYFALGSAGGIYAYMRYIVPKTLSSVMSWLQFFRRIVVALQWSDKTSAAATAAGTRLARQSGDRRGPLSFGPAGRTRRTALCEDSLRYCSGYSRRRNRSLRAESSTVSTSTPFNDPTATRVLPHRRVRVARRY